MGRRFNHIEQNSKRQTPTSKDERWMENALRPSCLASACWIELLAAGDRSLPTPLSVRARLTTRCAAGPGAGAAAGCAAGAAMKPGAGADAAASAGPGAGAPAETRAGASPGAERASLGDGAGAPGLIRRRLPSLMSVMLGSGASTGAGPAAGAGTETAAVGPSTAGGAFESPGYEPTSSDSPAGGVNVSVTLPRGGGAYESGCAGAGAPASGSEAEETR